MEDKVCVVTVTYGNRFHFLKQVVDTALKEGVYKVIVVDNNSEPESREKLKEYEKELSSQRIKVLYLDDNYGSAGRFKRGLKEAYNDPACEFIWLLDDDCVPQSNALIELISIYEKKLKEIGNDNFALCSFRPQVDDRAKLILAGKNKIANLIFRQNNTYKGFHVTSFLFKLLIKLKIIDISKNLFSVDDKIIEYDSCGYSGLSFNKEIIQEVGLPDENLFLYSDDIEYTCRITKKIGRKIFIVTNSLLQDIDFSYPSSIFGIMGLSDYKLYYGVRSTIMVEKKYKTTNSFIYNLNRYTFSLLLKILYFLNYINKDRYQLILKALKDGEDGLVGKTL
jgi:GT2 family glycosyltransferase